MKLSDILKEELDFKLGDKSRKGNIVTTVKDIDDETQSVTWDVKNELTDTVIHEELTKLINLLNSNLKNYKDKARLKSLLQKLKFIRNTFKRSMD